MRCLDHISGFLRIRHRTLLLNTIRLDFQDIRQVRDRLLWGSWQLPEVSYKEMATALYALMIKVPMIFTQP